MRKFIVLSFFILFITNLYSERAYLLPSINGEPSEVVPVSASHKNLKITPKRKEFIYIKNKGITSWLYYTDGGSPGSVLTGITDVDTFMVWFAPAAACSVLAYEVTNVAYTDQTQTNFTMFMALLDQTIDYVNDYDEYHGTGDAPGPPPIVSVVQTLDTNILYADTLWTVTQDTLITPIYVGHDIFGVGWQKATPDSSPNPEIWASCPGPVYHTLMYRKGEDTKGWYSSWHAVYIRALVNFLSCCDYVEIENLPDSYTTTPRTVNIYGNDFGVPIDSSGIKEMTIEYQVNGGPTNEVPCTLYSGDSTDGYWKGDIPGVYPGDTVEYWGIQIDYQEDTIISHICSYIIREGTPGNFLFVDNGYTESNIIPDYWIDTCDHWDYGEYGSPDSSVITFYNTILWRDWGGIDLGDGIEYGAGIYYSDTSWIKIVLDNGGNFWLSDQDQGYGLGICPDYGQYPVPVGHWVREYLCIQGMYDDNPLLGGAAVTAYGNSNDSIIGDMFKGIGSQNSDEVYIAPYYCLTNNFAYAYTGSFDSLQSGAVQNMFDANGLTISYRYTGPSENYKVYNDFWPWDYIAKPGAPDTLDLVAVDSLVSDVLGWFGYTSGVSDRTIEPEEVVKLLPVGIVTNKAMIRFYLPEEMIISLSIYDNTGRLIKNLKKGKAPTGLNTVRWDGKDSYGNPVSSGIYFCQLITGDKTLTNKMVLIK